MAKPTSLVSMKHKEEAVANAPLTKKVAHGSPYQLDPSQVERAATALVAHMKQHAQEKMDKAGKKSLAAEEDEGTVGEDPIFLSVATKQHVHDTSRLKPAKISVPHTLFPDDVRICIFTKDPQREYKNIVASDAFPQQVRSKVAKVIGIEKLKKKWKTFEAKRQLLAEYDVFMVDDRCIKSVVDCLGKTFYSSKAKRPIPIKLTAGRRLTKKDGNKKADNIVGTPEGIAREVEDALSATYVSMSSSANTSIKVGKASMSPQQLKENIEAVVNKVIEKHIEHKWRNIRSLHIKGPATKALPIWLAEELWLDEDKVMDEEPQLMIGDGAKKDIKKRKWDEWEEELLDDDEIAARRANVKKPKNRERKAGESISKEKRSKLKQDALQSVQTPLIAG